MSAAEPRVDTTLQDLYNSDSTLLKKFLLEYSQGIASYKKYYTLLRCLKDKQPLPPDPNIEASGGSASADENDSNGDVRNGEEVHPEVRVLNFHLQDLSDWNHEGELLSMRITENAHRYSNLISDTIDTILLDEVVMPTDPDSPKERGEKDTMDILYDQRIAMEKKYKEAAEEEASRNANDGINNPLDGIAGDAQNGLANQLPPWPKLLHRRYELRLIPSDYDMKSQSLQSLRSIKSSSIGRLVTFKGMVIRTSDVKPLCIVSTYGCDRCGSEIYLESFSRTFTPLRFCPVQKCTEKGSSTEETLYPLTKGSKFLKFQEIKIQELPNQVPIGHIPRSLTLHLTGELTRQCSPGDTVTVSGIFLPQKIDGFRMSGGLGVETYLRGEAVVVHKKSYDEIGERDPKIVEKVNEVAFGNDPVGRLSRSLAPEIFGHSDVKRALLLQLVGGCERRLGDGMRIRGDLNICLMGDPGVAKSQLLKYIASVAPRGVYTTGKGSSGVGLTAAITKDSSTGDMSLEGGALVLADRGVCCIDEFDKMDDSDRTSIHEVMEQQTVSIAKAGITATLNARAAVLAAANPLYGRYNRRKGLSENINLPNSLLSRFDLMFLILDVADNENDMALARHVTFVHKHNGTRMAKSNRNAAIVSGADDNMNEDDDEDDDDDDDDDDDEDDTKPLDPKVIRDYISRARQHFPSVPGTVAPYIVEAYVSLRQQDQGLLNDRSGKSTSNSDQTVMTARQLLSILRLSQALARLRFSDYVANEDVDEAIRLTHMSKASLLDDGRAGPNGQKPGNNASNEDTMSKIFGIIRDNKRKTSTGVDRIDIKTCEALVLRKGFTILQLQQCLNEYMALNILQVNDEGTHVDFLD